MRNEITHALASSGSSTEWLRMLVSRAPSYREATVDGARARYLCCGSGPPLLLLASPLALARTYERAVQKLARSFTVVCVEVPGSGGSERLAAPWTTARYAEWALELIRYLPLAAPIVVGHGASTPIATELARIAPSEIGGLVLVDAHVPGTPTQLGLRALPAVVWNALRHRGTFAEHVKSACTSHVALARPAGAVPTLVMADQPLASAIRRFMAAARHRPVFAT